MICINRSAIYSSTLYTGMRACPRCWSSWAMRTMVSSGSCFMMVMNFSLLRWQRSQLASFGARVLTPVKRFRRALGDLLHMGFSENPGMSTLMCNYDIAHLGFYGFLCFSLLLIQIRTRRTMGSCPLWQPPFHYK